jgi:hypothetical protein
MSQIENNSESVSENNSEVVSWFIDYTADYDFHQTIQNIPSFSVIDYLADYTLNIRGQADDFYYYYDPNSAGRNRLNTSSVNVIVNEFYLSEEDRNCCVCMDKKDIDHICKLNCFHVFCVECINTCLERKQTCPLCRSYITQIQTQTIEARDKIKH